MDSRVRYFEKTGSLLSADGTRDDHIKPQGADNFVFAADKEHKEEKEEKEEKKERAERKKEQDEGSDNEDSAGDESEEDDDAVFDSDSDSEPELEPDIHQQRVSEALRSGERLVDMAPALSDSLVGRRLLFRFNFGWFPGCIKRFYTRPRTKACYNVEVLYDTERGPRDQKLEVSQYKHDDGAAVGSWVLIE